jgi:sulfatase maturation enzyme AslB (radical SAM superfamily)
MNRASVVQAWGRILRGFRPNLSIEITRECPLRCPGCYAFGDEHLGGDVVLRDLADLRGEALVDGVLDAVARHRPIHLSLVGGEPLVRFRELDVLLPKLAAIESLHTQVVTSAVRPVPKAWASLPRLQICVSIDGLRPEHDARRAPATYDRILRHIAGHHVTVHCTITKQQTRPGYVTAFAEFWSAQPDVDRIWFSLYTPQRGEVSAERLGPADRARVVEEIASLRDRHPKLRDMRPELLAAYLSPPADPSACIFARSTTCLSADLERVISPCQFGGDPDCASCGCMATAALDAVGRYRLGGFVPVSSVLSASLVVGRSVHRLRRIR